MSWQSLNSRIIFQQFAFSSRYFLLVQSDLVFLHKKTLVAINGKTLNPSYKLGPVGWIYPWGEHNFFNLPHIIKFANFEFKIAIKGPKLTRRGEGHRFNTTQNRWLYFHNYPIKHKIHPIGPSSAQFLERVQGLPYQCFNRVLLKICGHFLWSAHLLASTGTIILFLFNRE